MLDGDGHYYKRPVQAQSTGADANSDCTSGTGSHCHVPALAGQGERTVRPPGSGVRTAGHQMDSGRVPYWLKLFPALMQRLWP